MTNRLSDLDVFRVDIVDRASVRDPENPVTPESSGQPARFLLWKSAGGFEDITRMISDALAKRYTGDGIYVYARQTTATEVAYEVSGGPESGTYQCTYTIDGANVALGTPKPVLISTLVTEKAEPPTKEKSMPSDLTAKLAAALSKSADNEFALDAFIAKDEITPEMAAAIKGAYRLLSTAKAALTAKGITEMAKAMGVELTKDGAGMAGAMNFGTDKNGKPFEKAHEFEANVPPDGLCKACGFGGNHSVHAVSDDGASGSRSTKAAEKSEAEPTEEVIKAELAKSDLSPAVRTLLEKSMETAKADRTAREKAERENVEKAEQIAKSEVREIVKSEMGHVPGASEDALADLLHGMRKSDSKAFDSFRSILKSASEAIASSELLKTKGSGSSDSADNPAAQIAEIAKGIAKAEGLTEAKAKAVAWERNPELRRKYDAEARARAAQVNQ